MSDFLNQILGALSGGARGYAAEKTGDEDRALKQQQIAAMYGTKGFHFVLDDRDHQLHRVNSITGIDYGPTTPEEVGFGQSPQQAAGLTGAAQGASTPGAPPVSASPVPQSSGPSVPDNAPENRDAPPVPATPAIPGVPPGMARAASTIGSGVRGPVKAPVLGTPSFVDAKVAEQNALDAAKLENEKRSVAALAPIKATSDSLAVAKRYQAEKAAGPVPGVHEITRPDGSKVLALGTPGIETAPASAAKQTPALMIATMNRLGLSEGDIAAAIDQMDKYETPENLKKLTVLKQAAGAASQVTPDQHATGLLGAINNAGGALVAGEAQKALQDDPEYRRYLRNQTVVGTAATEILPRPNQQLLQIEKGLSGTDVGWNPEMIQDIQSRRRRMRDMLHASLQSTPLGQAAARGTAGPSGSAVSSPPTTDLQTKRQAAIAALRAQGKSDMQITAILGEKP